MSDNLVFLYVNYKAGNNTYNVSYAPNIILEMNALCRNSYLARSGTVYDVVTHFDQAEYPNHHPLLLRQFQLVRRYVEQGKSVLYADNDTLCVGDISRIFTELKDQHFYFFNGTPAAKPEFPEYLNSGVVLFNPSAPRELLDEIEESITSYQKQINYDMSVWDPVQYGLNRVYHKLYPKYQLYPEYNFNVVPDFKNTVDIKSARILHFHSSRGTTQTLDTMRRLLGVQRG